MDAKSIATFARNAASTFFSVKRTVSASGLSIFATLSGRPMSCAYSNEAGAALLNGCSLSIMRLKENSTSSALNSRVGLNHSVEWNLTPRRSLKV